MRLARRTSRRTVVVVTDRRGLRRPILVQFLLLLSSLPSMAGMTDCHRHSGPSRVSVTKHLNSWNLGTWTTSLNFMMNQQDGPSWLPQSVTHSVTPYLVRLPHLPSADALRCHLRTVTGMTDLHKLGMWYFSTFLAQKPPHSSFRQFSANKKRNLNKN